MCSKPKGSQTARKPEPTWKASQTADRGADTAGDVASQQARRVAETGGQGLGNTSDPANPTKTVLGG
jgi:hypothetical protein